MWLLGVTAPPLSCTTIELRTLKPLCMFYYLSHLRPDVLRKGKLKTEPKASIKTNTTVVCNSSRIIYLIHQMKLEDYFNKRHNLVLTTCSNYSRPTVCLNNC